MDRETLLERLGWTFGEHNYGVAVGMAEDVDGGAAIVLENKRGYVIAMLTMNGGGFKRTFIPNGDGTFHMDEKSEEEVSLIEDTLRKTPMQMDFGTWKRKKPRMAP